MVKSKGYAKVIKKAFPGSFTGTDLEEWLIKHEIDTLVISGYMTQMCCDTTAKQAFHQGFNVEFLLMQQELLDVLNTRDM